MKPEQKIVKGSRVLIEGSEGWWEVKSVDVDGLTCSRNRGTQKESTWTKVSKVTRVSNKRTKGKRK